jgi:hypothetical protein
MHRLNCGKDSLDRDGNLYRIHRNIRIFPLPSPQESPISVKLLERGLCFYTTERGLGQGEYRVRLHNMLIGAGHYEFVRLF